MAGYHRATIRFTKPKTASEPASPGVPDVQDEEGCNAAQPITRHRALAGLPRGEIGGKRLAERAQLLDSGIDGHQLPLLGKSLARDNHFRRGPQLDILTSARKRRVQRKAAAGNWMVGPPSPWSS